ncbi:hypothetical protein G4B88_020048 [Cannabis sativa]|uniref:Exostosin GT47 domain-containing protein n=1 Tax=Cannabis sativa TaxID=3483 RepID=A0A7J6GLB9_CANSA|nr:hypothetical protein G4B88_020048 [Cannabis sativa]
MASALSSSTAVLFLSTLLLLILFFISHNLTLNQTQLTIHSYSYSLTNISTNNNNNTTITSIPIPSTSHDIIQNIDRNSSTTTTPPNVSLASFLSPSSSLHPNTIIITFKLLKRSLRVDQIKLSMIWPRLEQLFMKQLLPKVSNLIRMRALYQEVRLTEIPMLFISKSHIEMVKRFKVWSYKEGEAPVFHMAPVNNIYAIEGHFMDEIESEKSGFRARNAEEAHMYFLPLSVVNIISYVYNPILTKADYSRDRLCRLVYDYIHVVANKYPFWNKSTGADHFMLSCHDWAPEISHGKPQFLNNFIRVLCNANISEGFQPKRDVSLPEINLRVGTLGPPNVGLSPRKRTTLAFFAGRAHGYIRHVLFEHWKDKDDEVRVHEKLPIGQNYSKLLGQSKFCLCLVGMKWLVQE